MLTFDGKGLSTSASSRIRGPPNKEPVFATPAVVERVYGNHRDRLLHHTETTLDTHVHIPDFLKNKTWRVQAKKRQQKILAINNEHSTRRLEEAGKRMSVYTADNIKHAEILHAMEKHLGRLTKLTREHKVQEIRKENKFVNKRIRETRPVTRNTELREWYQHHLNFKNNRRKDPTAGHIMKNTRSHLLPSSLPPIAGSVAGSSIVSNDFDLHSAYNKSVFSTDGESAQSSVVSALVGADSLSLASYCPPHLRPFSSAASVESGFSRGSMRSRGGIVSRQQQHRKTAAGHSLYGLGEVDGLSDSDTWDNKTSASQSAGGGGGGGGGGGASSSGGGGGAARTITFTDSADDNASRGSDESHTASHHGSVGDHLHSHKSHGSNPRFSSKQQQLARRRQTGVAVLRVESHKILLAERVMDLPGYEDVPDEDDDGEDGGGAAAEAAGDPQQLPPRRLSQDLSASNLGVVASMKVQTCRVVALYEPNLMDRYARPFVRAAWSLATSLFSPLHTSPHVRCHIVVFTFAYFRGCPDFFVSDSITLRAMVHPDAVRPSDVDDLSLEEEASVDPTLITAGERSLLATDAKKIVSTHQDPMEIIAEFTTDPDRTIDAAALRTVLMKIFRQADDDELGELDAQKFKSALAKFDAKLTKTMQMVSVRELTKVIAEADGGTDPSKDDGMVDYGEYLDFAADLLITLRAREHGRMMTMKADAVMDGNIRSIMHKQVPSPYPLYTPSPRRLPP